MTSMPEYDLHGRGMLVDDALAMLERLISSARGGGPRLFAVVTGYGSSGGTSKIKEAVLATCQKYKRLNHIRGFLDGEKAGDMFSPEFLAFPDAASIPAMYHRMANPGIVIIRV